MGSSLIVLFLGLCLCHRRAYSFLPPPSIHRPTSVMHKMVASPNDDGVFKLPESDGRPERSAGSGGSREVLPDNDEPPTRDDALRVEKQMLLAFDNRQDFEIRDMAQRIFTGSTPEHRVCQRSLLRVTRQMEQLQAAALDPDTLSLGQLEYMEDAYRSLLSELRVHGNDADFFRADGSFIDPAERGFLANVKWPWSK